MNFFIKLFQPRLGRAIHRLGQTAGLTHPYQTYHNTMSTLSNKEEIEIIETASVVITAQKEALARAVQQLTPLADENLNLREIISGLESEDAASDAALASLRDLLPQGPAPETPPVDVPVVETPVTETPVE